jgi:F-type H+-transporting ATPase subunit b
VTLVLGVVTQSPNPILPSTGEIIWSVISFAILLALLVKFAFPPVAGMLQKRSEKIRTDLEEAEAARREAEALAAERRQALEEARAEGQRIIEDARATGAALREEALRAAQQEASALKEQANRQLAAERARLVLELRTELAATAVDLAGRILAKELAHDEVDPLVEQFLQESGWS